MLLHRRQIWETSRSKLGERDVLKPAQPGKSDKDRGIFAGGSIPKSLKTQ
ncbi:hypothetical protein GGTG_14418 [Gaeumannomyces tritici R3-111a-1]|uniref:Uncharacterized protein n=1 Tax=Gaeumannomyces tritici (strain R3-111a-1) TaxID=644352 RepID=J3PLE9_GAET3|nr:hypothetical protein GGTG_14418 [Gaeumannomyces tritici R3-111a-1]EJT68005.1 hypothetical protein GGTG_14418 [Gaeumannomyces tritici R3-111a-1]